MPDGELLGYLVVYLPEKRIYPDSGYKKTIVELLTLEQAETLAVRCRDEWEERDCAREDTQIVAVYASPRALVVDTGESETIALDPEAPPSAGNAPTFVST